GGVAAQQQLPVGHQREVSADHGGGELGCARDQQAGGGEQLGGDALGEAAVHGGDGDEADGGGVDLEGVAAVGALHDLELVAGGVGRDRQVVETGALLGDGEGQHPALERTELDHRGGRIEAEGQVEALP